METVQLSSSEDDDDIYLNSVAKLKALKKKQTLLQCKDQEKEEEKQANNEELKCEIFNDTVLKQGINRKIKNKKYSSKHRSAKQKQRKNISETDSDLEIVSIEEKNLSENDLYIVEDNITEYPNPNENYEINIKILWRSKNIYRLNICQNENFGQIFKYFANLEQVSIIKRNDTPVSINLSVIDILEGGIIKKDNTISNNVMEKNDNNVCMIKIQTTNKKSLTIFVKRDENFKTLLEKCAQEFNIEKSKIKLYFDGELIAIMDTPDSLEIEDEACFDLQFSS
ncbi:uncharacterized protein CG4449 [Apis laboriosa]|uniref:uncharacterized protein CG4449 n=1 Tax=Apis laboriosa TaxID=183418 RepID=UPI001CC63625|nr:uncharacterized protein CG4449 [Apis laboriosa]